MLKVVQCPQCGAGLPKAAQNLGHERECHYCGSLVRVDPALPHRAEAHEYLCSKHCPRCHHKTVDTEVGGAHLRACHQCGGLWVPHKALRRLGHVSKKTKSTLVRLNRSSVVRSSRDSHTRHDALRCPQCAKTMMQKVYSRGATVTVDICKKHGTWFDENELMVAQKGLLKRMDFRDSDRRRKSGYSKRERDSNVQDDYDFAIFYVVARVVSEVIDEIFD